MARQGPMPAPHLRVVASSTTPPGEAGRKAPEPPPVLVGLLLCGEGGQALGVVREILGWDGQHLSLRLTLDPPAQAGRTDVTVRVPLPGRPPLAGHPKAVAP